MARLIILPDYRGAGIATHFIRFILPHCPTRYAEGFGKMAQFIPVLKNAGMTFLGLTAGDGGLGHWKGFAQGDRTTIAVPIAHYIADCDEIRKKIKGSSE